jgi:Mrp family chromosome partitioning ATPase
VATYSPEQARQQAQNQSGATTYSPAYQRLYTNIALSWSKEEHQHLHTLLLTTPQVFSESAVVAANIAMAASQSGITTLLIDADLRAAGISRYFGLSLPGLSDLYKNKTITPQSIQSCLNTTAISHLFLLSAGQKHLSASEIGHLFTMHLEDILRGLRQSIQEITQGSGLIIFHCPAVIPGVEASLISAQVEQTFLLLAAGHSTRTEARRAQAQLQRAHANLEGILWLNR